MGNITGKVEKEIPANDDGYYIKYSLYISGCSLALRRMLWEHDQAG